MNSLASMWATWYITCGFYDILLAKESIDTMYEISFITYSIHRVWSIVRAKNVLVLGNIRPNSILPNVGRWRASVWNANIKKKSINFQTKKYTHLFAIRYTYPFWHMVASNNGIRLQISTVTNYNGIQAIIKTHLKLIQKQSWKKR